MQQFITLSVFKIVPRKALQLFGMWYVSHIEIRLKVEKYLLYGEILLFWTFVKLVAWVQLQPTVLGLLFEVGGFGLIIFERLRIWLKNRNVDFRFRRSSIYLLDQKWTPWPYLEIFIYLEIASHSGEKFRHINRQLIMMTYWRCLVGRKKLI